MVRHAAAAVFAVALCLSPSWLWAQTTEFRVDAASANVHKYPSIGSPIIGKATRGAVLEVMRELGDWVKVSWPEGENGVAYVHLSVGSVGGNYVRQSVGAVARGATRESRRTSALTVARPAPASTTTTTTAGNGDGSRASEQTSAMPAQYVTPPAHVIGLGGQMGGSTLGFGASARAWSRNRLGIQFAVSRDSLSSAGSVERLTSTQFAPSVLYSLRDRVTDYVWLRPYLGGGASLHRQTLSGATPGTSVSDNSLGIQAFGGGEFTFPSLPRFALSADVGYNWLREPFAGYELGGLSFSVSGHWYIR